MWDALGAPKTGARGGKGCSWLHLTLLLRSIHSKKATPNAHERKFRELAQLLIEEVLTWFLVDYCRFIAKRG